MRSARTVLAAASVALFLAVLGAALALGPWRSKPWLVVAALMAVAMALFSVTSEPKDLTWTLVFSALPVAGLVAAGSPTWLVGPFAAALLVAAELNTLSWEWHEGGPLDALQRGRLAEIGLVAGAGLAAGVAVIAVAQRPLLGGTVALVLAAVAVAGVGRVVFRSRE